MAISKMCESCIHHKVCMHDKNLMGDVFVPGNPLFFDNKELYKRYEEWKAKGFPCDDYMSSADVVEVVRCKDCKHQALCDQCIEHSGSLYHLDYCSYGERKEHK